MFFPFHWMFFLFLPLTKAKHLSHPDAWAFLKRVCSGAGKEGVPPEAVAEWQAGVHLVPIC